MNTLTLKKVIVRISVAITFAFLLFIANSCRKEIQTSALPQVALATDDLSELKKIYSQGIVSGGGIAVASTADSGAHNFIYNRTVKWDKYVIKDRVDKSRVIEFDMQKDSATITTQELKRNDTVYFRNKSATVFIKFNNGSRLNFFMKVIEDFSKTHHSVIDMLHYGEIPTTFTGTVFYYTLDRKFINGYRYLNGKIVAGIKAVNNTTRQQVASLKTNLYQDPGNCGGYSIYWETDCWYLVLADGTEINTGDCEETVTDIYYNDCDYRVNGGVNGDGNYGGNQEEDTCPATEEAFFDSGASTTDNTTLGVSDISSDASTNTRVQSYKWCFVKNIAGFWSGNSFEEGKHKWVSDHWEWVSLTHSSISVVGTMPGGVIELKENQNTPTILNPNSAYMTLNFNQKLSLVCKGFPISRAQDFTATSDTWNLR